MRQPPPSIDALVREHGARLYGICVRLDPDPEDAWQSVWERVVTRIRTFDPSRGTIGVWLSTVTHRLLVDRHRGRQRRPEGHLTVLDAPVAGADRGPSAALEARELLEQLLEQLATPQRRVVVLFHLGGLTIEQIAATEDIALGTVKSRLHRGRAQLATWMREENQ